MSLGQAESPRVVILAQNLLIKYTLSILSILLPAALIEVWFQEMFNTAKVFQRLQLFQPSRYWINKRASMVISYSNSQVMSIRATIFLPHLQLSTESVLNLHLINDHYLKTLLKVSSHKKRSRSFIRPLPCAILRRKPSFVTKTKKQIRWLNKQQTTRTFTLRSPSRSFSL